MHTASHERTARFASGWLLPPPVVLALLYGGAIACWFLYLMATVKLPGPWHEGTFRMIPTRHFVPFTVANVGLVLWLLASLRRARRAPVGLRRGQTSGVLLAIVLTAVLQAGAQALHRAWPSGDTDPARLDRYFAELDTQADGLASFLRETLAEALTGYREVLDPSGLHFRGEGELHGHLNASQEGVNLVLYGPLRAEPKLVQGPWTLQRSGGHSVRLNVTPSASESDRMRLRDAILGWTSAMGPPRPR